ncbi:hypothetical protein RKE29_19145 [Streptomyces sp. B1866]|uniref:hypothetical protein n=1 Tax=Streptomyces sp. B1866 TaxID=3075431 RepID=UPI00288C8C56|nr:hypothetical protein [Streptomyces sp. B1866]MDT3398736.1 hypothetical protein [Streptomyces sp. B1866]
MADVVFPRLPERELTLWPDDGPPHPGTPAQPHDPALPYDDDLLTGPLPPGFDPPIVVVTPPVPDGRRGEPVPAGPGVPGGPSSPPAPDPRPAPDPWPTGPVPPDGPSPLGDRIMLGGPLSVPVTPELIADDAELRAFVAQEAATAAYHLVHTSLTCDRDGGPALRAVSLGFGLSAGAGAPFQPVAWSMTPKRLTEAIQTTTSAQLGPQLGFVGHSRTTQRGRVCLEALRELRSDPGWEIRRTRTVRIGGTYRLTMVVRAPRGAAVRTAVAVRATVRRGLGSRHYRQDLPGPLLLDAAL